MEGRQTLEGMKERKREGKGKERKKRGGTKGYSEGEKKEKEGKNKGTLVTKERYLQSDSFLQLRGEAGCSHDRVHVVPAAKTI